MSVQVWDDPAAGAMYIGPADTGRAALSRGRIRSTEPMEDTQHDNTQRITSLAKRLRKLADALEQGEPEAAALLEHLETSLAQLEHPPGRGNGQQDFLTDDADRTENGARSSDGEVYAVWADGSCAPNPGPGGWGAIVEHRGEREELSGAAPKSTNNIMELTAAIEGLRRTPQGATVRLTTDSQYVKNGITKWIHGWKRKNWRKADGQPVLNRELWQALDEVCAVRDVSWFWVRGHNGHPENERCDELANEARKAARH